MEAMYAELVKIAEATNEGNSSEPLSEDTKSEMYGFVGDRKVTGTRIRQPNTPEGTPDPQHAKGSPVLGPSREEESMMANQSGKQEGFAAGVNAAKVQQAKKEMDASVARGAQIRLAAQQRIQQAQLIAAPPASISGVQPQQLT